MQKADKDTIKRNNKKVVLSHLRDCEYSRTELAEKTGLSNSTISALITELIGENIVFEKSVAQSSGGRKPIILSLNPDIVYTMQLKLAKYRIIVVIIDLKLNIVYEKEFEYKQCSAGCIAEAIRQSIGRALEDNSQISGKIVGVGISIPGLVDYHTDKIQLSSQLHLKDMDIKSVIRSCIDKSVYVFKDTDALMLGESILKGFNRQESYLYLLVDSGVGLSFMNKGEILQLNRSGLQIGHVQLDSSGPQCNCGNYGCVEAFVSEQAAQRNFESLCAAYQQYEPGAEKPAFSDIVRRSNLGDPVAGKVLVQQCTYLGRVVAIVINLFSPNTILIGGPLSNSGRNLLDIVVETASQSELEIFRNSNTTIEFTNTGDKASFIGMANKILYNEFYRI